MLPENQRVILKEKESQRREAETYLEKKTCSIHFYKAYAAADTFFLHFFASFCLSEFFCNKYYFTRNKGKKCKTCFVLLV